MERNKKEDGFAIVLGIVLAYFLYSVVMNQLSDIMTDFNGHTYGFLSLFAQGSWLEGRKEVPYCMWHLCVLAMKQILRIPLEVSAAYVGCMGAVLSACSLRTFVYQRNHWSLRRFGRRK